MLKKNNIIKYINSVLVISGEYTMIEGIRNNPYVYSCIYKPYILEDIKNNIAKVKRQNIKTLDMIDDSIIVEGLRRNDLVVVRGANEIMDGQKVKIKSLETE